jgi:hypothetical protein
MFVPPARALPALTQVCPRAEDRLRRLVRAVLPAATLTRVIGIRVGFVLAASLFIGSALRSMLDNAHYFVMNRLAVQAGARAVAPRWTPRVISPAGDFGYCEFGAQQGAPPVDSSTLIVYDRCAALGVAGRPKVCARAPAGEIVNLMQIDAGRLAIAALQIHQLWSGLLQTIG